MNQKLTATLQSAKKVSKGEYVFSKNRKPYLDVKTGWLTPEPKRKAVKILEKVASNLTTQANPDENWKVVSIRKH